VVGDTDNSLVGVRYTEFWYEHFKKRGHLGDLDIDGWIRLKFVFMKCGVNVWAAFTCIGITARRLAKTAVNVRSP
jgi:hypothetical protein